MTAIAARQLEDLYIRRLKPRRARTDDGVHCRRDLSDLGISFYAL
jgi:hypothetical protein